MEKIILVGGGGHCKSVMDTLVNLNKFEIEGILDIPEKIGQVVDGVTIIDSDDKLEEYYAKGINYAFITIGSIGNTSLRSNLYQRLKKIGFKLPSVIDMSAIVSRHTVINEGTFIGKGAIINSGSSIGSMCIINTGAIIEHDCNIGNYVHIAPGATISGGVEIGDNAHIGTNSTIIQYRKIGKNTIIGAGSVVVSDISANIKAYGNPCREVFK